MRDLELDARNRPQKRDQDDRERRDDNVGDCNGGESSQRRTVPENHADEGLDPTPENHVDAGTVLILENRVDVKTVHVRAGMLIGVRIP